MTTLSRAERRNVIERFYEQVSEDTKIDQKWMREKIEASAPRLPDEPTAEQLDAWVELAEIIADPAFVESMRTNAREVWTRGLDLGRMQQLNTEIGAAAKAIGQLPYDKDGNLVGKGDIKAQTRRIFEQIKMIVETGGGKMDDVVKVTVFVTDVRYREGYGEVRSEFFGPNPPASTLVQISNLAIPDALIEIEAVAVIDG